MLPTLIYRSYILDNNIKTEIFYEKDHVVDLPKSFCNYSSANNLTKEKIIEFAKSIDFKISKDLITLSKKEIISHIDSFIEKNGGFNKKKVTKLAKSLYYKDIKKHTTKIPKKLRRLIHL